MSTTTKPMIPASTELPADVDAVVSAYCAANDRSRAWVIRQAVAEWAKRQSSKR